MDQPQSPGRKENPSSTASTDKLPTAVAIGDTTPGAGTTIAPAPLTPFTWLRQSAIYLVVITALVVWLYRNFGIDGLGRALLVYFGLGFVLFIHVLGHFLAAKWYDVHVRVLSFGFGPALPGLRFQCGETLYKVSILPLAGYVTMVGRGSQAKENEDSPRSFKNKTVGQRMLIVSAGIISNVLLGFLCFFVVSLFHREERSPAVVWRVEPGSVAWKEGVRSGSTITRIGNIHDPWFDNLRVEVALSRPGRKIPFVLKGDYPPTGFLDVGLEPRKGPSDPFPMIGVAAPARLKLAGRESVKEHELPVSYDSPAAHARVASLVPGDLVLRASDPAKEGELTPLPSDPKQNVDELCRRMTDLEVGVPLVMEVRRAGGKTETVTETAGFEFGDSIIGTTDPQTPDSPFKLKELPADSEVSRESKERAEGPFEFRKRLKLLAGKPMVIQVIRDKDSSDAPVNILVPPAFHWTLGVSMKMGEVAAVRDKSPAAKAEMKPSDILKKMVMEYSDGDKVVKSKDIPMEDPTRLPFELAKAARERPVPGKPVRVLVTVLRPNPEQHKGAEDKKLGTLDWDDSWDFQEDDPLYPMSPMSIPQLGIAYRVQTTVEVVKDGSPAADAGIQKNDLFEEVAFRNGGKTIKDVAWTKFFELKAKRGADEGEVYDCWAHFFWALQRGDFHDIKVKVRRDDRLLSKPITLQARLDRTWPLEERGLVLANDLRLQKAPTVMEALTFALDRMWTFLKQQFLNLGSLFSSWISPRTMGGPIALEAQTAAPANYPYALLLWLGMISLQLALLNFLPLPLLDGRDMVFLTCEKVLGKPLSQIVRAVITYLGWAILLLLVLFVFYLDLKRRILNL